VFWTGQQTFAQDRCCGLARRLLIDFWRYLETGLVPEGAELKIDKHVCSRDSPASWCKITGWWKLTVVPPDF